MKNKENALQTENKFINMERLAELMIRHGVVLRAIPKKSRSIFEKCYADRYDGEVKYLENFKREMLIHEYEPDFAGKFLLTFVKNSDTSVKFKKDDVFDSLEEVLIFLEKYDREYTDDIHLV